MSNPRNRTQSMEFRQQEVGYVMERWRAGDSCSLVGVGSVGKSNLLQHLSDESVQSFFMKDVAGGKPFKAIIIDPSMLGPLPSTASVDSEAIRCWAGYELMMHRLFLAFYPFNNLTAEDARIFYDTYQALQDGTNPLYAYMGLRYFELGLEIFMKQGTQVVFMFDEFEEMLKQLPIKFFLTLRGLRDANKRSISYLTFTRSPLPQLIKKFDIDVLEIEPFTELFNDNIVYVGPYNENDARNMVMDLVKRNERKFEPYAIDFLLWATGRYAGLLRSSFRALDTLGALDANTVMTRSEQLLYELVSKRAVRSECETIWKSLSDEERKMVQEFSGNRPNIDPNKFEIQQIFALLQQKQLLKVQGTRVIIDPPIFQAYVKSIASSES
ncbi:MAG: hypothetical protein H0X30_06640 [Anaerolineae bacterium]|nr:hypothetical protein [Anaerolineae bacterium]